MNGGYYQWYDERELARRSTKKRLKIALCAIIIFVLASYLAGMLSSFQTVFVYHCLDVDYGDFYVLDRICDIFVYSCQLLFPAVIQQEAAQTLPGRLRHVSRWHL